MTPRTGPKTTILLHFRKNAHSRRLSTQKLLLQTTCEICGLDEDLAFSMAFRRRSGKMTRQRLLEVTHLKNRISV